MIFSYLLLVLLFTTTCGKDCSHIKCANVFDEICGIAQFEDGIHTMVKIYQNICLLSRDLCEQDSITAIYKTSNELCEIRRPIISITKEGGRRVNDFSIVGAHQACNHTCPTYCPDTYEPACAQIWKPNMKSFSYRPMINHCHVDQFSCAAALNVTIQPLGKCYKNPAGLLFMQQVAALKSLDLLDVDDGMNQKRRFTNDDSINQYTQEIIKGHLWKFRDENEIELTRRNQKKENSTATVRVFDPKILVKENTTWHVTSVKALTEPESDKKSSTTSSQEKLKTELTEIVKRIFRKYNYHFTTNKDT